MPHTLNDWVKQQDIDTETLDGLSADERERIKSLQREVKELRRANDILKTASAFLDAQLTSLLDQSHRPDEVIICDDGSSI